ncbi:MAG: hypothetical protein J6X56_02935 [Ruminococcus sp.]|nr:hypothetical protein [Ruminococcus sp.]
MRSYKEIADIVREQGDAILERRKIRARRIKRISCAVSGLCAAVIICAGVWHNSVLRNVIGPDSGKIPIGTPTEITTAATEAASVTTASTAVTEVKTTSVKAETVTTSAARTTAINAVQTSTKNAVTYQPVTTARTVSTAAAVITGTSNVNAQTTTLTERPGNTSVTDPHGGEEIAPATTEPCNLTGTVPTVSEITSQTTTIAEISPEDGPVTTSNTGASEIIVTTVPEESTTVIKVTDEETIKEHISEITFSRRTYTYDRSVDYKPDLTMYMPFDNYWLQGVDESSGTACTAKTQLYMPETGEKDHIWLKFDKKKEYCLYTAKG